MENQINNPRVTAYKTRTIAGVLLLSIGLLSLVKHSGFYFPHLFFFQHLLFSWPVILIAISLYVGAKHNFQKSNWIVLTAIGVIFLLPNIIPSLYIGMLWPLLIIALGISIYNRRNHHWNGEHWEKRDDKFQSFDKNI